MKNEIKDAVKEAMAGVSRELAHSLDYKLRPLTDKLENILEVGNKIKSNVSDLKIEIIVRNNAGLEKMKKLLDKSKVVKVSSKLDDQAD